MAIRIIIIALKTNYSRKKNTIPRLLYDKAESKNLVSFR